MTLTISRTVVESVKTYLWSKDRLPYQWGGSGNPGGDCSWITGAAAAGLQGMQMNRRYGYTGSFNHPGRTGKVASPEAAMLGLSRAASKADVPADAVLKLGFFHSSDPAGAHTSGTLDGLNFESRGMYQGRSGHVIGPAARAWNDPLYNDWWYLDARIGQANPDDFPLPAGWYYGPLSGPDESVSGEAGEPAHQIAGIRHMQAKLGIEQTGRWIDAKAAIIEVQKTDPGILPDGTVGPKTWALIMRQGGAPVSPGGSMSFADHAAVQWGQPHQVRQIQNPEHVHVKEGEMWARAGLADVWNETVWDGYPSRVPGDDRTGSLVFWVLEAHKEAVAARVAAESLQARLASGQGYQQPNL